MKSKPQVTSANLLDELQEMLAHGTVARRVETLRRVTDLFLNSGVDYSPRHIELFDDIFNCIVEKMEISARALLSERLAPIPATPPGIARMLAFDDSIEVAAPMLSHSERLDDVALIESARTKSQAHLLAISIRKVLSNAVTDVLVERGNHDVVRSTFNNSGAQFSEQGYGTLLARSETDDNIAICVASQIPRHHYLHLVAKASASVRDRLASTHPKATPEIAATVREVARRARSAITPITKHTEISHDLVRSLYEDGRIDEAQVTSFANADKFDETNASIACMANVTVGTAETMMMQSRSEGIFVLAKVAGFSWPTVKAIIDMRERLLETASADQDGDQGTYERLRAATAQQVLRFHRMEQGTAGETAA
jgi:uncharacterized protein (DUF2336 family)